MSDFCQKLREKSKEAMESYSEERSKIIKNNAEKKQAHREFINEMNWEAFQKTWKAQAERDATLLRTCSFVYKLCKYDIIDDEFDCLVHISEYDLQGAAKRIFDFLVEEKLNPVIENIRGSIYDYDLEGGMYSYPYHWVTVIKISW